MTATAPQPGPPRSRAARPSQPSGHPQGQTLGQAQAHVPQRQGQAPRSGRVAPTGTPGAVATRPARRRFDTSSTPNRLRIVRGVAAAACLIPGIVGMVQIASAATAPVSSPTQTYAELRAGAAAYEATATAAATRGGQGTGAADLALTRVSTQIGAGALLYPDRSTELYKAADELAARQTQMTTARAARDTATGPTVPAPSQDLTAALGKLGNPPAARSAVNSQYILVAGGIGLAGLLGASGWLARKTKRVINPGLVAGILLTAAVTALGYQVLAARGTGTTVNDIAQVRADAAQSVAAEAAALYTGGPDGTAIQQNAKRYVDAGTNLVRGTSASWANRAASSWNTFQSKELTAAQLGNGDTATRQGLVAGRVADLTTLDASLASLARDYGAGADQRPNSWAGYGLFALSLLAGAAAWTGVGRRVTEYR